MTVQDTLKLKRFPVVVESDCPVIDQIYPTKQEIVSRIFEIASGYKEINRVFIFGSATTAACTIDSDLDICLDADVQDGLRIYAMQKEIGELCDWNCDIIMYCHLGSRLKKTIEEEGVLIYE